TVFIAAAAARAEDACVHAGGAYRLTPPAGWQSRAFVDARGYPFHVFSPDAIVDSASVKRGLWVYAVPIPNDEALDAGVLATQAATLLSASESDIKIDPDKKADRKLGPLDGKSMKVEGRRKQ